MMEVTENNKEQKGCLHITSEQLPKIKNWKVGKKYNLNLVVEQKSVNSFEDKLDASFDVIKATASKAKVSEEDYKNMSDEEKDKADEESVMGDQ